MLSNLPAPLPSSLPPRFIPTSSPSPPSTPSSTSFAQYVRSQPNPKRRQSSSISSSDGDVKPVGLGLGLSMSDREPEVRKKRKVSPTSPELVRSMTPLATASPVLRPVRKDHGRSGLRNEISEGADKSGWSSDKWRDAGQTLVHPRCYAVFRAHVA